MKILRIILFTGLLYSSLTLSAQTFALVEDPGKQKIWKSMEAGTWDFSPDWYFYVLHKKYSGASGSFNWKKFKLEVEFDVDKSNVKQIAPVRENAALKQLARESYIKSESQKIETPFTESVAAEADRLIDATYPLYKEDFERMQGLIADGLVYCMSRSKGAMQRQVDEIARENSIVCEKVAYIHKTGIDAQLENSQRQKAYEEVKAEMKKLTKRTAYLTALAVSIYK